MIDWPNAIVGFLLGFASAVPFWVLDRRHGRRQRHEEILAAWTAAAKEIELLTYRDDTTAGDLYVARVRHPIELWRSILGPDDFRLLEDLEVAWQGAERVEKAVRAGLMSQRLLETAFTTRREAQIVFANMSRLRQNTAYAVNAMVEDKKRLRAEFFDHPIRTWKRERHNRRVRRAAGFE